MTTMTLEMRVVFTLGLDNNFSNKISRVIEKITYLPNCTILFLQMK